MTGATRFFGHLLRSPTAVVSLIVITLAVVVAIGAPFFPLPSPEAMDSIPYQPPGAEYWFGTDNFGRDVLSRVVWGARLALIIAIGSSALSTIVGVVVGSLSGYHGGWI